MQILFLFDCFVFCLFGATLHTMATYVRFTGIQIMPVTLCYPLPVANIYSNFFIYETSKRQQIA